MRAHATILLIEDDSSGRDLGAFNLRRAGYAVDTANDGARGLDLFAVDRHDLVVTDLRMPRVPGMEVLRQIKQRAPDTPVIVITAYGNVELAVQAMKLGAADYVGKPFNREHLLLTVARVLETSSLQHEVTELRVRALGVERPIVADSDAMDEVLTTADRLAASTAHILLQGETGTGRGLLARRIHVRGKRPTGPFVSLDCASLDASRAEHALVGISRRPGCVRQAHGGTLFLREIVELPLQAQAQLMHVLEHDTLSPDEPTVERLAFRIIASTSTDLHTAVTEKRFRDDLRYQIAVGEIAVPPLRERVDDIEPLARFFTRNAIEGPAPDLADAFIEHLKSRTWYGNVRELKSACERAAALMVGPHLDVKHLPPATPTRPLGEQSSFENWPPLPVSGLSLFDLEKRVIERVLELKKWNVSQAAVFLHVPRHILAYRMEKYGIHRGS
ncbi:MAG: sigma-54 dependent transcriptional regulator [Nannocystaceae bacterium]